MTIKLIKSLVLLTVYSFLSCAYSQDEKPQWIKLSTNSPTMSAENAMVYDIYNKKIINYGGRSGFPEFKWINETWAFDYKKSLWKNMKPANSPPWRSSHAMAYDTLRHRTLLFGGNNFSNALNDLWLYDYQSNNWTQITTSNTPEQRQMHGMVYIPDRDIIMMFGGRKSNGGASFSDTWELGCTTMTWKKLTPKRTPPVSDHINIVYDEFSKKVILYVNFETWAYDFNTKNWTKLIIPNTPDSGHSNFVYNTILKKSILFGDSKNSNQMHTWLFDYALKSWTDITPRYFPDIDFYEHEFIEHASMIYMNDKNSIIQYGGCCSKQTLELKLN